MRVFLFILFSSIAISSQVPSKFTLHTTGNETRFIYHSGKEATVSLQNSLAGNLNSIDSSSIRRFQISATASSFSNVPHADHTRSIFWIFPPIPLLVEIMYAVLI